MRFFVHLFWGGVTAKFKVYYLEPGRNFDTIFPGNTDLLTKTFCRNETVSTQLSIDIDFFGPEWNFRISKSLGVRILSVMRKL